MIRIPPVYLGKIGAPLYWGDESVGDLRAAVLSYLNGATLTDPQLDLLRAYIVYHIHAPAWLNNPGGTAEYLATIGALQEQAEQIRTTADIDSYIDAAAPLGLDPL